MMDSVARESLRSNDRAAKGDLLAAATTMDAVTLHVADIDAMTAYYRDALGLKVLSRSEKVAVLGRQEPLMILRHEPALPVPSRREAGLFHTALLFPTQQDLAATLMTAARHADSRFAGSADHLVSKAFYFTDPEGNGIELYWDRSRTLWTYDGVHVRMATDPLDPRAFLDEHLDESSLGSLSATHASVGHVHLQVGSTEVARDFYVDTLGFEATFEMPSALFVSAGGYHHHMAMNTWNSHGAGPRAATLGLGQVSIKVPTREDVASLLYRLGQHGVDFRDDGKSVAFEDPWSNLIKVSPSDS
ncbi:MAG: hypothetical protein JWP10_888 [Nocardioidaceae bacterium]|nr:hypothetical protein [Nocardioidaceae bacterium]